MHIEQQIPLGPPPTPFMGVTLWAANPDTSTGGGPGPKKKSSAAKKKAPAVKKKKK